jgi:DNA-binding transcriptional MocR family regulator
VNEGAAWFPSGKSGELVRIAIAGAHADDIERGIRILGKIGEKAHKRG